MKTVKAEKVTLLAMVAGGEKKYSRVINGDRLVEWVGIGWIPLRKATAKDKKTYPTVVWE